MQFLLKNCTKNNDVGSTCHFFCAEGYDLMGEPHITCENTSKWSNTPPICKEKCPPCTTGPSCEQKITWQEIKNKINNNDWGLLSGTLRIYYARFYIKCAANIGLNIHWKCTCTDQTFHTQKTCDGYLTPTGTCERALAELVRAMVKSGQYPQPCDEWAMTTTCHR